MNKSNLLVLLGLFIVGNTHAQQKAVTDKGVEVVLYDDGTWKYVDESETVKQEIQTNPIKFYKDVNSTFLLKSTKIKLGFYINPKNWLFEKASPESIFEYDLSFKKGELYARIITEKLDVPIESLKEIALMNAKKASPDIIVVKEEFRIVNGLKILFLQFNGTIKGIKFTFFNYYYSDSDGAIQFLTYSSESVAKDNFNEMEKLLNGIIKIN